MRYMVLIGGTALMMAAMPAAAQSSAVALATGALPVTTPRTDSRLGPTVFISRALIEQDYRYGLVRLRKTALKQQAADGGRLTPASIAGLQARLDKLNTVRSRDLELLERS